MLVRKGDLRRAAIALQECGYVLETSISADGRPKDPKIHEYKFRRGSDGLELELRWRLDLNWGRYGRDLGFDWVWPHHATTRLAGAAVPVLNPEVSLLVLCMHGCKHQWSRLIWVCDIAKVISASPSLDWPVAFAESKRLGLKRAVGLGILLSERMLGLKVPQSVLDRIEEDRITCRIVDHFANNLLERPGEPPPGRVPYGFRLLDFEDRAKLILSLDLLHPSDRDREVFGLPDRLGPLYYLLRPLRLLWDRSAR